MRREVEDLGYDDPTKTLTDPVDRLDGHTEIAHDIAEGDGIFGGERCEFSQPGKKDLHEGNCSRNRTSPVYISRMSSTP